MRFVAALLCTLVLLVCSVTSSAQDAAAESLEHGRAGLEHFDAGRFQEAYVSFTKADALYHTPVYVLYVARSLRGLKRLLEARRFYDAVIAQQLDPDVPPPWVNAQSDARVERDELVATIPKLTVTVDVPAGVTLMVGGQIVGVGAATEMDPGAHKLEARYLGRVTTRTIELDVGDNTVVQLELKPKAPPQPTAVPPAPPPPPPPITTTPDDDGPDALVIGGGVLLGVGAVGLVIGAIAGPLALGAADDARRACTDDGTCPTANEAHRDRALNLAHISTASFAIGGALALTGAILFGVGLAGDEDTAESVYVTPYGLGLRF